MIFEQVYLIDIEKAAMCCSQQTWRERLDAIDQCALQIDRTDDTIFGSAEW